MANKFDFARANRNTKNEAGWCERWAEQGFGLNGLYPSAWAAWTKVPKKRGGLPPSDGNYYLVYFDGWWKGNHYADIAVYRNGKVWSGSDPKWRNGTSFNGYRNWIATKYLGWSEYIGAKKVATYPLPKPKPSKPKYPRKVTVTSAANVRSRPSVKAPLAGSKTLKKGDVFTSVGLVSGDKVSNNNKWHKSSRGNYVWSGNTSARS